MLNIELGYLCYLENNTIIISISKNIAVIVASPIGLMIVSAARIFGAVNIYIIDINDSRLAIVKELCETKILKSMKNEYGKN